MQCIDNKLIKSWIIRCTNDKLIKNWKIRLYHSLIFVKIRLYIETSFWAKITFVSWPKVL